MRRSFISQALCFVLMAGGLAATVRAQSDAAYPSKSVRLVIPFPPGGSTDILGRIIAESLSKDLGQSFLVVNVGGAGGTIGAAQVVRSPADGYTLFMGTPSTIVNQPLMNSKLGYDPMKELQPVSFLWSQPAVLLVNREGPYKTLKELIAEAKRSPGKLNFGSNGVGGFNHLAGELFNTLAGVKITHVPYKGAAPAMNDLLGKNLDVVFGTVAGLTSAKGLTGLAVASATRSPFVPSVPTFAEAGVANYIYSSWGGLFSPSGTPSRTIDRLVSALDRGMKVPSVKDRFLAAGIEPISSTPAELQKHIANEYGQVKQIIATAGIKGE